MSFAGGGWRCRSCSCPPLLCAQTPAAANLHDWSRFSVLTPAGPEEPQPEVFRKLKRLVWATHKVSKGEYSSSYVAKLYGTTVMSLQATNHDELYLLGSGRKLVVHNKDGMLYEVKKDSETLGHIVARFKRGRDREAAVPGMGGQGQ